MGQHRPPLAAIAAGVVLLAVVPLIDRPEPQRADPEPSADQVEPTPVGQLESLSEPEDLDAAETAAREFALALVGGDLAALEELTTPEYAERLIGTQARAQPHAAEGVTVEAIIPRDLHNDGVTLQVVLRHTDEPAGKVEAFVLVLARSSDGSWQVEDGAI